MENNTNQINNPMLCKRNCGFFGNAACDGYCSKCYKDHVKRQNTGSAAGRVTPTSLSNTTQSQSTTSNNNNNNNNNNIEIPVNTTSITSTTESTMPPPSPIINTPTQTSIPIPIPSSSSSSKQQDNNNDQVMMSVPSDLAIASSSITSSSMDDSIGTSVGNSTSIGSEKKKRTRCSLDACKRKVGLTGYDCRCGGIYCWEHRYSDKHNCNFDYKELGQDQIRKNNPIVVGEKIQKI